MAALRAFLVLAYTLTWVLLGPWFYLFNVVYQQKMPGWLWVLVPLAFIGGWGPSVAALIVTARTGGRKAVRQLVRSALQWRVPIGWYLIVLVLPPLVTAASLVVVNRGATTLRQFDLGAALTNIPIAYALALPFGPLGEELGWRGFALPRLLTRFGPVKASLLLGGFWTFWHIPMMLWSPGASIPAFLPLSVTSVILYWAQVSAITAMMALLFLGTNGSVFLAILGHLTFNTAEAVLFGGLPKLSQETQRAVYLVNVALLALLGLITLVWLGKQHGGNVKQGP
jgi:CAAX protease family protein